MAAKLSDSIPAQVLVVEDENEIRDLICLLLLRQGLRVQSCTSVIEADEILKKSQFDVVILDWMLPQSSGIDFLKSIRSRGIKIPVLMVTAKSEPQDVVFGLENGADDYMSKPFEPAVLIARTKALLRRAQVIHDDEKSNHDSEILRSGGIEINLKSYECKISSELVHLTPSEFKILSEMIKNQGRVLTRETLVERVQGEGISVTGRTIDTHVFGLRKKMGDQADWIETIRGVGYRVRT